MLAFFYSFSFFQVQLIISNFAINKTKGKTEMSSTHVFNSVLAILQILES